MADRSQPDANNIHSLIAVSNADGISPVTLWADPTTHALVTSGSGGGASGTQYTQGGATVANPTGTAQIYFDGSGNPKAVTPSTPLPVSQTDGTNSPNVLKGDGTSAGNNALLTAGSYREIAFTTTTTGAQTVASQDASAYRYATIMLSSAGTGLSFTAQVSSDNTNWITIPVRNAAAVGNNWTSAGQSSVNILFETILSTRYFRINISAMTGGTTTGVVEFYATPPPLMSIGAAQNGTWSVGSNSATGSAVPANAFYMGGISGGTLVGLQVNTGSDSFSNSTNRLETASEGWTYNGTNWDKIRSATSAAGTTGTGVPAAGMLGFDGTNYQRVKVDTAGNQTLGATATGGYTPAKLISAATTNATSIKASAGTIGYISAGNTTASAIYLKVYDKATAPTVGTDVPIHTFIIPGNASGAGSNMPLPPQGILCSNGIAIAITGAATDADTTAVTAGAAIINYGTK